MLALKRSQVADRSELQTVDLELARLGRGTARLRLQIGEALHVLGTRGWERQLGFSSVKAYCLERCERGPRWAAESRSLARRLLGETDTPGLPLVRAAVVEGSMLWSMAELVARHATADDETEFVEAAAGRTVRQMKQWIAARSGGETAPVEDDEEDATVQIAVGEHELLMFEATRVLIESLDGRRPGDERVLDALLAEGMSSMADLAGRSFATMEVPHLDPQEVETWRELLRKRDADRAEAAEGRIPEVEPLDVAAVNEVPLPDTALELDALIQKLCRELVHRDLRMGQLAAKIVACKGWARLGYASLRQYAQERVGVSLSSFKQRLRLAKSCDDLPEVAQAVSSGKLGFEAARLVAKVATLDSVDAWIDRATRRTVVHLREEVEAIEIRARHSAQSSLEPPGPEELEDVAAFKRSAHTGELFRKLMGTPEGAPPGRRQISVRAGSGQEVRMRVSPGLFDHFAHQQARFRQLAPEGASFLGFLMLSLWQSWLPTLEGFQGKWKHIHLRDGLKCQNPTCDRRDVTPHHLRFVSQGGGHEDENLVSLCSACHLEGVHGGRIKAEPPASKITWTLGRDPILKVVGRVKVSRE